MITTKKLQLGLLALLFSVSLFARAEVALTEEVVDRWMTAQKALQAWGEEHEEDLKDLEHDGIPANVEEFVKPLKNSGMYSEVENLLEEHGFDSPEQWADISLRIMHAMGAVQMQQQANDFDAQAQIDRIKNDPNIPQEQKDMMLQMMNEGLAMMERAQKAPAEDVEAIRPQVGKLMQFFDEE